jgi:antitoxin (DNA-binding transcriptional repressor) of toxin-antitoxin stability system
MKTFSIMETQHNLALVLREVAAGHEVGITRHKKLVARLLPPAVPTAIELPDFVARARNVWHAGWSGTGTSELLEETRGSR